MIRRALLSAVLIAGAAASGWAAESATYILINGQRQSGYIVYGRGDNNIVDLQFHVNVSGNDVAIPMAQVAAIDFVGGDPPTSELDALPSDGNTGVMVMRNGTTVRGHLHNIIGNDNVQWVNESGQRLDYPIRDVSRLYLSPRAARAAYQATAAPSQTGGTAGGQRQGARAAGQGQTGGTAVGQRQGARTADQGQTGGTASQRQRARNAGQGQTEGAATEGQTARTAGQRQRAGAATGQMGDRIRVDGNQQWIDTGIDVRQGDRLVFDARGNVTVAPGSTVGPEGTTAMGSSRYPVRNAPAGALIAAVGNGAPFVVGSNTQPITMPASGRLMLGINDDNVGDNTGAFTVTISR